MEKKKVPVSWPELWLWSELAKVKNKAAAENQICSFQLLREAIKERDLEIVPPPPKRKISNPQELADDQRRERQTFEDNIRKNRTRISNWIKYAKWEESQKQVERARSVYERALDVDDRNINLWLKYAEMEMRNLQVNHARSIWDRAVTILPLAKQFWYKYTYMEEKFGNVAGARMVFERWMEWQPEEQAWLKYVGFELRNGELRRARDIYNRFTMVHPKVKNWIYAKFEESLNFDSGAGAPKRNSYTMYEKKLGDKNAIEGIISSKPKFQYYEQKIKANPMNYDAWFDYIEILECEGDKDLVRDAYKRGIANIPPAKEKQYWRRYIYLWIHYAVYEELHCNDNERARQIYKACLDIIPHKKFTFAKIWLLYANFEVRQRNLHRAREILDTSIDLYPKNKIFKGYIDLELQLQEIRRCRILYEKYLTFNPVNSAAWVKYAELETFVGDVERARDIYKLGVGIPCLDQPDILRKSYNDFEISQNQLDNARKLNKKLLEKSKHLKKRENILHNEFISFIDALMPKEGWIEKMRRKIESGPKGIPFYIYYRQLNGYSSLPNLLPFAGRIRFS